MCDSLMRAPSINHDPSHQQARNPYVLIFLKWSHARHLKWEPPPHFHIRARPL